MDQKQLDQFMDGDFNRRLSWEFPTIAAWVDHCQRHHRQLNGNTPCSKPCISYTEFKSQEERMAD